MQTEVEQAAGLEGADPNTLKMPQPTLIDAMKMDLHKTRVRAGLLQDAIDLLDENPCIQEFIDITNKMRQ